jgi:hypothetical protein
VAVAASSGESSGAAMIRAASTHGQRAIIDVFATTALRTGSGLTMINYVHQPRPPWDENGLRSRASEDSESDHIRAH